MLTPKTAEEIVWESLSPDAQMVLEALGKPARSEGYNGTFYGMETESESVRAAMTVLMTHELVEAQQIPRGPIVYRITPTGLGVLELGKPEEPEQERETKRVSKYLSEHSEVDPRNGRLRRKR